MMKNIAKLIDHTLLAPDAREEDILRICEEAKKYQFASACVHPTWVQLAHTYLSQTDVKVCTVIGFPLGATTTEVKAFEAQTAIENGASEIDMVINIGALKSKQIEYVEKDIAAVCIVAKGKAIVKVIIETALLTNEEKKLACELAKKAGADFVKTSTGFAKGGATVEDVTLMRETVGDELGVKASGGIRSYHDVVKMVEAGASRIGASSGIAIMEGNESTSVY